MKKEKIFNLLKNRFFIGAVCLVLGGAIFSDGTEISQLEGDIVKLQEEVGAKDKTISELQTKVDEATPWFDMKEEERQAEEARLAEEQAQKEAEAKAAKEAEAAKAKEEEEARKVEEQKKLENANCIKKAQQYINYTAFSRSGLIEQLEYEGYSKESAEYSVDSLNIDWNSQCAKKAQQYLDYTAFSRDGLYDQLAYEGFSSEQIEYGLGQVGY